MRASNFLLKWFSFQVRWWFIFRLPYTPPPVRHAETKIYNPKEISILTNGLDAIEIDLEKKILIAIALSSSARQSEILGLEKKHCDFEKSGIIIKQAITVETGIGVILKETKNKGIRFISLPDVVIDMIKKLIHIRKQELLRAGDKRVWKDQLFLFGNEFGKPYRPDSISQWWIRFMQSDGFKTLGLPKIRFHDLRHSSLTYFSNRGLRLKAVQKRAGHTKMGTTFDIYGHALSEENQEAAEYAGEMFEKIDIITKK